MTTCQTVWHEAIYFPYLSNQNRSPVQPKGFVAVWLFWQPAPTQEQMYRIISRARSRIHDGGTNPYTRERGIASSRLASQGFYEATVVARCGLLHTLSSLQACSIGEFRQGPLSTGALSQLASPRIREMGFRVQLH